MPASVASGCASTATSEAPSPEPMVRFGAMRSSVLPLVALAALLAGCAGGASTGGALKSPTNHQGPIHPAAVDERSFGGATYKLLLAGDGGADRLGLLVGVTRHQLERAQR